LIDEFFQVWAIQYLLSGTFSILLSLYVLHKRPRTMTLKGLFFYGLSVTLWEFAAYVQRVIPDQQMSAFFFILLMIFSHFSLASYLLTILSIREEKRRILLALVPVVATCMAAPFLKLKILPSKFGWSFATGQIDLSFITVAIVYITYLIVISYNLIKISRKARSSLLRKKYLILLTSFVSFQAVGVTITNYYLNLHPDFPPLGGVLNLLTFIFIGYALLIKEERIQLTGIGVKDFPEIYVSFLAILYNATTDTGLGEKSYKFMNFIKNSGIQNQVVISERKITFEPKKDLNIAELIVKNLKILENEFINTEVIDYYLRILNAAYVLLGDNFNSIIMANEEFLKKSDLMYGIGKGCFIEKIIDDKTLNDVDDVEACLKIYKRILLLIAHDIPSVTDISKKLAMYHATKNVKITEYGEVSMLDAGRSIMGVPKEEQLTILIESFNSFVSWVYDKILSDASVDTPKILENLHLVLTLNKKKADELNIYHTFLGRLATRIPKTQIHKFYSDYLEELVDTKTMELKEIQKKLLESERLAAIGETAAMVGHDLRNPLQVIYNSLYLLKTGLGKSSLSSKQKDSLDQLVDIVIEQSKYMNKIVSDLQDYTKTLKVEIADSEIETIINEAMSTSTIPQNVNASIEIENGFPAIPVDPVLMKRVFTNLITNAVHAMPDGGQLKIAVGRMKEDVVINVTDTGVGIAKENLDKIFTPLFTTKAKGQGFGLAVCRRLIEAHGGKINVESEVNKGTKFIITLPLTKENEKTDAK